LHKTQRKQRIEIDDWFLLAKISRQNLWVAFGKQLVYDLSFRVLAATMPNIILLTLV